MKRVFIIVLDSVGAGSLPDAAAYGDEGAFTLKSVSRSEKFCIPNLRKLGIGNIEGLGFLGEAASPLAAYGRCSEKSSGKDTTTGHWEIAGLVSEKPFPTFPNGFPKKITDEFSRLTERAVLCNKPYSGTQVIADYGEEHMKTGALIVYTSADSVFQIAAHESIVPREKLYEYCIMARKMLTGEYGVGRVIARPFAGNYPDFYRTDGRHDFSLCPPKKTVLDCLCENGKDVIAVGKINDIFAGKGITESIHTSGNAEGCAAAQKLLGRSFNGLCFVNLVDFDMLYGHRNDVDGYASALTYFDSFLDGFIGRMQDDDVCIITADHGCDPSYPGTDHTREYIPLLVYGKNVTAQSLGTRIGFSDIAAFTAEYLGVEFKCGKSFSEVLK